MSLPPPLPQRWKNAQAPPRKTWVSTSDSRTGSRSAVVHHAALVQDVGPVHDIENRLDVVLDDEDGRLQPLIDLRDFLKDLFHHHGRKTMSGFVEQQYCRIGHSARAPAPASAACPPDISLAKSRRFSCRMGKSSKTESMRRSFLFPIVKVQTTHLQVLLYCEVGEHTPAPAARRRCPPSLSRAWPPEAGCFASRRLQRPLAPGP